MSIISLSSGNTISTILKHDNKQTSYKIALLHAINDLVLSFPDMQISGQDVAIPLRILAEFWLAYYWPFVDPTAPIYQGNRAYLEGTRRNDMAFRPELTAFRKLWQEHWGDLSSPSDGFFVINELRIPRIREQQPKQLLKAYHAALKKIAATIRQPIQYAGPGEYTVFDKPKQFRGLTGVSPIPGHTTKRYMSGGQS